MEAYLMLEKIDFGFGGNLIVAAILVALLSWIFVIFNRLISGTIHLILDDLPEIKLGFEEWIGDKKKDKAIKNIAALKKELDIVANDVDIPFDEVVRIQQEIEKNISIVNKYSTPELTELEKADAIIADDVTLSTLIFNKIDEMILLETQNILIPLASTGQNIDVRNYSDHFGNVATAVQKGLNIGVYKSTTMFTPEYINSYIIKKSAIVVLTVMTELNKQLPPPQ